jgi:hypothetical protein
MKSLLTAGISTVATRREQFGRRFPALKRLSLPKSFSFALEARWKLAGGGTAGNWAPTCRAPAGAQDGTLNSDVSFPYATIPRPCRGANQ